MGNPFTRKKVIDNLEELKEAILNYYGAINENKAGLNTPLPDRPEAMYLYDKCKSMGIPLVAGGLRDQPHIFLLEWNIVEQTSLLMQSLPTLGAKNG